MALTTFTPAKAPSMGTEISKEAQGRSASFGDGYTQSQPTGLNNIKQTLPLTWELLSIADADAIDAFMTARNLAPFYFTPFYSSVPIKWTCKAWKQKAADGGRQVTAQLERYFGVET